MESRLALDQREARPEQSNGRSGISLGSTNQSDATFDHSQRTRTISLRGSNQRRATSVRTLLTFDDSLRALNESEARFEQRAVRSTSCDLTMGSAEAAIVACELRSGCRRIARDHCLVASMHGGVNSTIDGLMIESCRLMSTTCGLARGIRHLGMERRDVESNGRELTADGADVGMQRRQVSLHWCLLPSTSRDLATGTDEAAIVACEVRSRCCLIAMDHCLVASRHGGVNSTIDGLTIDSRRLMSTTCGLARGRRHPSSSRYEAHFERCVVTSARDDANIVTCDVARVRCHLAPGIRLLGMERRDVVPNGRDPTADDAGVARSRRQISSHWRSRASTSRDLATGVDEAAIVACEVR
jgi:hypothetical protein